MHTNLHTNPTDKCEHPCMFGPTGVLQDSNVVLGDKDGVVSLTVHDNGNDWQPPKGDTEPSLL